jgi:hypothetical protein
MTMELKMAPFAAGNILRDGDEYADVNLTGIMKMNKNKIAKVLFTALAACAFSCALIPGARAQPANIALGKTVTFSTPPNYALCTDPDDDKQLTDGLYSSQGNLQEAEDTSAIWVQKGTVGWRELKSVAITIDLGAVQPISGVSYSTAARPSDVQWPLSIYMAVSDDNITWRYAGDLVLLSRRNGLPPATGHHNFRYVTHDLRTKGRYISFGVIVRGLYSFVDEIEVYKGDDAWLNQPPQGAVIPAMKEHLAGSAVTLAAQRRLDTDSMDIRVLLKNSSLSAAQKNTLSARLDKDAVAAAQMKPLPIDFKTILPLNETHRDILAVHGAVLKSQGFAPLTVWKQHRYDYLPLLAKPAATNAAQVNFSMLGNQFRSDNLLLTNADEKPQNITLQLKSLPPGAREGWLKVYSVAWTDTIESTPVPSALMPVQAQNGVYRLDIPAGMTRKVWFTVDSSKVPAGQSRSTLAVNGAGQSVAVPFILDISKVAMKTPRFSVGMWDYTNGKGANGITPENRVAAIEVMRSHFVDTPWATGAALPRPVAASFDAAGNLQDKLDFSTFDEWVALWPGARNYFVFAAVSDSFAGAKMDSPEFSARVGSWAKALSSHMRELGKNPKQLGLLLVDEPHTDAQDEIIVAWAKAINAVSPELTLFEDPVWPRPDQAKTQDAFTQVDILCAHLALYVTGGEPVQTFYEKLRLQGKTLWLYQTYGPARLFDPQQYYRYQAWHAFAAGATGQGFWAFGDLGGAPTSWNSYSETGISYAPAFLDKATVIGSVHWDAVREGVEDYEELAMLKDAIRSSKNAAWKAQAQQVLDDAVQAVTAPWSRDYAWNKASNAELADAHLLKVRTLLDEQKM